MFPLLAAPAEPLMLFDKALEEGAAGTGTVRRCGVEVDGIIAVLEDVIGGPGKRRNAAV